MRLRILIIIAALAVLACSFTQCQVRGPTKKELSDDASIGALIGALFGGPAGAPIGAAIAMAIGVVVRSYEKGKIKERAAEEKIELTDQFARRLEGIATTQTYRASEALTKNTELG